MYIHGVFPSILCCLLPATCCVRMVPDACCLLPGAGCMLRAMVSAACCMLLVLCCRFDAFCCQQPGTENDGSSSSSSSVTAVAASSPSSTLSLLVLVLLARLFVLQFSGILRVVCALLGTRKERIPHDSESLMLFAIFDRPGQCHSGSCIQRGQDGGD